MFNSIDRSLALPNSSLALPLCLSLSVALLSSCLLPYQFRRRWWRVEEDANEFAVWLLLSAQGKRGRGRWRQSSRTPDCVHLTRLRRRFARCRSGRVVGPAAAESYHTGWIIFFSTRIGFLCQYRLISRKCFIQPKPENPTVNSCYDCYVIFHWFSFIKLK